MSRIQQILSKAERDGTLRPDRQDGRSAGTATMAETAEPAAFREVPPPTRPPEVSVAETGSSKAPLESIGLDAPAAPERRAATAQLHRLLVAALAPSSPAAEHYRSLRARIGQSANGRPLQVVLITSPARGDGKTVTTANLALTMAQEFHRRVLLLDADLRTPRAHALFGLGRGPGLAEVLAGAASLDEALIELPEHRLTVLRAGEPSRWPAELLGSTQMRRVVDTLRSQFDRILVDTAPAHLADASVVAPLTDGVLLVIRAGQTSRPAIEQALGTLASFTLLGLVLNASDVQDDGLYASAV